MLIKLYAFFNLLHTGETVSMSTSTKKGGGSYSERGRPADTVGPSLYRRRRKPPPAPKSGRPPNR